MADESSKENDDFIEIKVKDEDIEREAKSESSAGESSKEEKPVIKPKTKSAKKKKAAKKKKKTTKKSRSKKSKATKVVPKKRKAAKKKDDDNTWLWAILIIVGLAVIGSVIYLSLQQPQVPAQDNTGDDGAKVVALLNNEPIYEEEITRIYDRLPDNIKATTSEESILEQIIEQKLLLAEAESKGLTASAEEIAQFKEELKAFFRMDDEQLKELLDVQGITQEEFDKSNEEQIIITKLLNESVYSNIVISDKQVAEYYETNKENYKTSEAGVLRHILVSKEDNESDAELLQRAEDVRNLIDEDFGNFCNLVTEHSKDEGSIPTCGEYSVRQDGTFVPEFEEAAFSLEIDEVSIVSSIFGQHIIWKKDFVQGGYQSLSDVGPQIRAGLEQEVVTTEVREYIASLKDAASIELYPVDTQDVPTTPVSEHSEENQNHEEHMDVEVVETKPVKSKNFKECLMQQDATFYGVYWSPDVKDQKEIIADFEDAIEYIDCDPTVGEAPAGCEDVSVYPTWNIGGKELVGKQSVHALSVESGCSL